MICSCINGCFAVRSFTYGSRAVRVIGPFFFNVFLTLEIPLELSILARSLPCLIVRHNPHRTIIVATAKAVHKEDISESYASFPVSLLSSRSGDYHEISKVFDQSCQRLFHRRKLCFKLFGDCMYILFIIDGVPHKSSKLV